MHPPQANNPSRNCHFPTRPTITPHRHLPILVPLQLPHSYPLSPRPPFPSNPNAHGTADSGTLCLTPPQVQSLSIRTPTSPHPPSSPMCRDPALLQIPLHLRRAKRSTSGHTQIDKPVWDRRSAAERIHKSRQISYPGNLPRLSIQTTLHINTQITYHHREVYRISNGRSI